MKCPNCGNSVQDDAIFCDRCGARLTQPGPAEATATTPSPPVAPAQGIICPQCGASNTPGEMFCSECGTPLAAPQPEPNAVIEAPSVNGPLQQHAQGRTCPVCGVPIAEGDTFCYACGAELDTTVTTQAALSPAAPYVEPEQAKSASAPVEVETPAVLTECPACGGQVAPGDVFCEFCGAALVTPKEPAAPIETPAQPAPIAAPGARLLVVDSGVEVPLSADQETIVGREDPYTSIFPDVDLTPYGGEEGGVSRKHFKIMLVNGQYTIEDLGSTNFTLLNQAKLQPGAPMPLSDGDEIRAGRVKLTFKVGL
mgnify:CR=1 FL=1